MAALLSQAPATRCRSRLQYSLSDRIRYYWPDPQIIQAQEQLFENLSRAPLPLGAAQPIPAASPTQRCAPRRAAPIPLALVLAHIGPRSTPITEPAIQMPDTVMTPDDQAAAGRMLDPPRNPPATGNAARNPVPAGRLPDRVASFLAPLLAHSGAAHRADRRRHVLVHRREPRAAISRLLMHGRSKRSPPPISSARRNSISTPRGPRLLVSFGRSGNSPESIAAIARRRARVPIVGT